MKPHRMLGMSSGFSHFEEVKGKIEAVCYSIRGAVRRIEVTPEQRDRIVNWVTNSTLIQDALPDFTVEQREILLSGTNQEDWDNIFGAEKKEE